MSSNDSLIDSTDIVKELEKVREALELASKSSHGFQGIPREISVAASNALATLDAVIAKLGELAKHTSALPNHTTYANPSEISVVDHLKPQIRDIIYAIGMEGATSVKRAEAIIDLFRPYLRTTEPVSVADLAIKTHEQWSLYDATYIGYGTVIRAVLDAAGVDYHE